MPKPPQLAPFDAQEIRLYSGPADVQSKAEPSHSTKETSVTTVTVCLFFFYYERVYKSLFNKHIHVSILYFI